MVVMLSKEKTESTLNRSRITRLYILIIIIIFLEKNWRRFSLTKFIIVNLTY